MRIRGDKWAWPAGLAMATLLWALLFAFADVRFATNDDQILLRLFTGRDFAETGPFNLFLRGLYTVPLWLMNRVFPGFPALSVLEIALQWLSIVVIVKSILQCSLRRNHMILGLFLAVSFILLLEVRICARLTFTTVSASLCAACIAQFLSIDFESPKMKKSLALFFVLFVLAYELRRDVFIPTLFFVGIGMIIRLKVSSAKTFLSIASSFVLLTFLLMIGEAAEIRLSGQKENAEWHEARYRVLDYMNPEAMSDEGKKAIGWSDSMTALFTDWYTMEETVSTRRMQIIRATEYNETTRTSPGAAVWTFRNKYPECVVCLLVLAAFGVCALIGCIVCGRTLRMPIFLIGSFLGCAAFLAYLALQGRLLDRSVMVAVLPEAALLFCLMPQCMPPRRLLSPFLCTLLAACVAWYTVPVMDQIKYVPPKWEYNTFAAMDSVALANKDTLFVYSPELVNDLRLFPDFSSGIPDNLTFWGGWQRATPQYAARLSRFGFDSEHFTPADWLKPDIRYLTLQEEPDPALVEHLREELGDGLAWEQTKLDEALYAYRFYVEE